MNESHEFYDEETDELSASSHEETDYQEVDEPVAEQAATDDADVSAHEQGSTEQDPTTLAVLPLDTIVPNPSQPRKFFEEESLKELVASIKERGVLQPIVVRKVDNHYQIVMGERRWRAAKMAGLKEMKVLIRALSESDAVLQTVTENEMRKDLTRIERADGIAHAYQVVKASEAQEITVETFATRLGMKLTYVQDKITVSRMPEYLREVIRRRQDGERHALSVFRAKNLSTEKKQELAGRIISARLTVKQVEMELSKSRLDRHGSDAVIANQKATIQSLPSPSKGSEPNSISLSEYSRQRSSNIADQNNALAVQTEDFARAKSSSEVAKGEPDVSFARAKLETAQPHSDTTSRVMNETADTTDTWADVQGEPEAPASTPTPDTALAEHTDEQADTSDIPEPRGLLFKLARELEEALDSNDIPRPLTFSSRNDLAEQLRRTAECALDHAIALE